MDLYPALAETDAADDRAARKAAKKAKKAAKKERKKEKKREKKKKRKRDSSDSDSSSSAAPAVAARPLRPGEVLLGSHREGGLRIVDDHLSTSRGARPERVQSKKARSEPSLRLPQERKTVDAASPVDPDASVDDRSGAPPPTTPS